MEKRPRLRRLLAWLRVEDEHGRLSLTTVAFGVGCACLLAGRQVDLQALAAFALSLGAYQVKRVLQHREARVAMAAANEAALLQLRDQLEAAGKSAGEDVRAQVADLATKVKELREETNANAQARVLGRGR